MGKQNEKQTALYKTATTPIIAPTMMLAEKANSPNPGMPMAGEAAEEEEDAGVEVAVAPEPDGEPVAVAVAAVEVAVC